MRRGMLVHALLAAVFLGGGPAGASGLSGPQEEGVQARPSPGEPGGAAPTGAASPARVVAGLVREALARPEAREVWEALPRAILEMEEGGTERAGAVAGAGGSVALPGPVPPASTPPPAGEGAGAAGREGVRGFLRSAVPWGPPHLRGVGGALGVVVLVGGAGWFGLRARWGRRAERWAVRSRAGSRDAMAAPDRAALALALWESGLPVQEVSRRTGMARDAVTVLLRLRGEEEGGR